MRFIFFIIIFSIQVSANTPPTKMPDKGILKYSTDSFFDPNFNYTDFGGRVTDKDVSGNIIKVSTENRNIRFMRIGDPIVFKVVSQKRRPFCKAVVRGVEIDHLTLYIQDLSVCWDIKYPFRRGSQLIVKAEALRERLMKVSQTRRGLLQKRTDLLAQLNEQNRFIWNFKEKQLSLAAEFDARISAIQREKSQALLDLQDQYRDSVRLQKIYQGKISEIDYKVDRYRIDYQEQFVDPWSLDHDTGVEMERVPRAKLKDKKKKKDYFYIE